MTKAEFLATLTKLYLLANMSDSDNPAKPDWMHVTDCSVICSALDDAMKSESFNSEERQDFYDNLLMGAIMAKYIFTGQEVPHQFAADTQAYCNHGD